MYKYIYKISFLCSVCFDILYILRFDCCHWFIMRAFANFHRCERSHMSPSPYVCPRAPKNMLIVADGVDWAIAHHCHKGFHDNQNRHWWQTIECLYRIYLCYLWRSKMFLWFDWVRQINFLTCFNLCLFLEHKSIVWVCLNIEFDGKRCGQSNQRFMKYRKCDDEASKHTSSFVIYLHR